MTKTILALTVSALAFAATPAFAGGCCDTQAPSLRTMLLNVSDEQPAAETPAVTDDAAASEETPAPESIAPASGETPDQASGQPAPSEQPAAEAAPAPAADPEAAADEAQ